MGDSTFSPEARDELLAMYTGMAMQGLLVGGQEVAASTVAHRAVIHADALVSALEAWHARQDLLDAKGVSDVRAQ